MSLLLFCYIKAVSEAIENVTEYNQRVIAEDEPGNG